MTVINKLTRLWGPLKSEAITELIETSVVSKSQKLFLGNGLMQFNDGYGTLLPFLVRSLRKLENIVRKEMALLSAQEILLPTLINSRLLEISGRININELYKLLPHNDKQYILSPTNEEAITNLMASLSTLTFKQLPYRFFQITNKFRNEKRVKSGLLRSKEFVMKDLYCFDSSEQLSENTYEEVVKAYNNLFKSLGVPHVCITGETGNIGGKNSNEFHFLSDAGEDKLIFCQDCGHNENSNANEDSKCEFECLKCHSKNIEIKRGIEVGHTFNLGTTYTKKFNATFKNKEGKAEFLHMSSYGLGLTRIIGAVVEVLSTPTEIRWPISLAPYLVCVLPPKAGSKEEAKFGNNSELIYNSLNEVLFDEIVLDDETQFTIGKRLMGVKKLGFPYLVVVGKSILKDPPLVEIHDTNVGSVDFIQVPDISQFILQKLSGSSDNVLLKMGNV